MKSRPSDNAVRNARERLTLDPRLAEKRPAPGLRLTIALIAVMIVMAFLFRGCEARAADSTIKDSLPDSTIRDLRTVQPVSWVHRLKPSAVSGAASFRSAKDPAAPFDWELSAGATWARVRSTVIYEREDGRYYWGYEAAADTGLSERWSLEVASMLHEAAGIDRQTALILREFDAVTGRGTLIPDFRIGGGVLAEKWSDPIGAIAIRFSLTWGGVKCGQFAYSYGTEQTHVAEVDVEIASDSAIRYKPFVRGFYRGDVPGEIWKIKTGLEVIL